MSWAPFLAPSRDLGAEIARPKSSGGTIHGSLPGFMPSAAAQSSSGLNGLLLYTPFHLRAPVVVTETWIECVTQEAGTNFRGAIYTATRDWQPAKLLLDTGDLSVAASGIKTYAPSPVLYLPPGPYLTAFETSGSGTAAVRAVPGHCILAGPIISAAMGASYSGTPKIATAYAAYSDPGTAWDSLATSSGTLAFMFLKLI